MDKTITINKNELTDAFKRIVNKNPVGKVVDKHTDLLLFAVMISIELEKELFIEEAE